MGELKTLANCKPSEFLRQTARIKDVAERWLIDTKIMETRATEGEPLEPVTDDMSIDERIEVLKRNKEKQFNQAKRNISKMYDAISREYPEETLELLALCCFVEPEDVDNHSMSEYLDAFTSLMNDRSVIGFFSSLIALVRTNISTPLKA